MKTLRPEGLSYQNSMTTTLPTPLALVAELTHRCPLHCVYCSNPLELAKRESELPTHTWVRVFQEAAKAGVLQVDFTGGEPLARTDIIQLVHAARVAGLYVSLITSGLPLNEAEERLKGKTRVVFVVPDYYAKFPKPCVGGWGRNLMLVSPNGAVLPCHAAGVIPGIQFENVKEKSLREIWESSPAFQKFRGEEWMQEPCKSCDRRHQDFGGCRCQAMLLAGDAVATDPVCSLAPTRGKVDA